jgi:hypothetical protein
MAIPGNIDSFSLYRNTIFRPRLLAFLVLSSISSGCLLFSQSRNTRAEASFSPPSITLSNSTIYKIVLYGTQDNPEGSLPAVSGLNISKSPQVFRSASFINGTPSVRLEMSFQVKASREGTFTLPSWIVNIGGKPLRIPAATLQVLAPSQQDLIRKKRQREQEKELKDAAFIEFDTSRPFLFEGETIPATVQLFLWDRLPVTRIEQAPVKDGDSFSMTELRQPNEKRNFSRNGKTYAVFSWPIGLTAAMAGQHKLSFSTSIRVRVSNRRSPTFNSPFNNDPFFGFGREESLTVKGDEMTMEVRSLPMKGRPIGFQGAIGTFTSESRIDSDSVSLGDPVRLVFEISGTGNFAAVPAPEINSNQKLKIGPPSFSFEGNQITKHEGKQSFEYIVTPLVAGLLEIPPIEFAYFDPIRESFFSASTLPHPLQVDRGEQWTPTAPGSNSPFAPPDESTRRSSPDLFQAESEPGKWVSTLEPSPLMNRAAFWYFQAIPLAGFCSLTFWGVRRKGRGKEKFKRKENSLSRQMKDAVGFNDASSLLRAFRDLLRLKIAKIHKHPNPSSLASEELLALLQAGKNSNEVIDAVKELLRSCDDQEFAGNELAKQPVEDLYRKGFAILKKIR